MAGHRKPKKIKRLQYGDARLGLSVKAQRKTELEEASKAASQRREGREKLQRVPEIEDLVQVNDEEKVVEIEQVPDALFFDFNAQLGPPYRILMDTNFVNFAIQHKTDIFRGTMDCLMAKCFPTVTDCVVAELEKMGPKCRLALRTVNDPRVKRLKCLHRGTYADDCLVNRVKESRCYILATNDKDLKRRVRKIPGVPIMFVTKHKFEVERMPDAVSAVPFSNAKLKASLTGT